MYGYPEDARNLLVVVNVKFGSRISRTRRFESDLDEAGT